MSRRRKKKPRREGRVDVAQRVWEIVHRKVPEDTVRLTRVRELWDEIAPRWVAANTWPALLRDERLVLHVQDNQWLHELNYWRQELLSRLEQRLPELGVERIEAFLGHVPPPGQRYEPEATESLPPPPPPPLEPIPPPETLEALNTVTDAKLRDLLAMTRLRMGEPRRRRGEPAGSTARSTDDPSPTSGAR